MIFCEYPENIHWKNEFILYSIMIKECSSLAINIYMCTEWIYKVQKNMHALVVDRWCKTERLILQIDKIEYENKQLGLQMKA